jgi:hypothetical protein
LEAGATGLVTDQLNIGGSVISSSGDITLKAGDAIIGTASTSGILTLMPYLNLPPPAPLSTNTSTPVTQAVNTTTSIINTSTTSLIDLSTTDDMIAMTSTTPTTTEDTGTQDDDVKQDMKDVGSTKKSGVKNESAPKMYCN